jgi:hypothetical protein
MRPSQWEWPWKALVLVLFALAMWGTLEFADWTASVIPLWFRMVVAAAFLWWAIATIIKDWLVARREHRRRARIGTTHQGTGNSEALSGDLLLPPPSHRDANPVGIRRPGSK